MWEKLRESAAGQSTGRSLCSAGCRAGDGAFKETFKLTPWMTFCSPGSAGHRRAVLLCSEMLPAHLGPSPGKDRQVGPGPSGRGRGSLCSHGP